MNSDNTSDNWLKQFLEKLDPQERREAEQIWEESKRTDESQNITLSEKEKRDVFSNIASQTGISIGPESVNSQAYDTKVLKWKWVAAAAIILIAAGISYLTIPVEYSAPYGRMESVVLPDDSQITLNSGSTVTYSRLYNYLDRDVSLQGEAFFEVEKGELPFVVHTSNASVKVLGTSFNVRSWQDEPQPQTSVTLTEGSLSFYPSGQPENSVILKPGETSNILDENGTPTEPVEVSRDRALAWLDNHFAFEAMPFIQIIREIERRFDLNIRVQPKDVLLDTLTIYYNKKVNAEQIIRDISQSKGLSYRKINGGYVIEE